MWQIIYFEIMDLEFISIVNYFRHFWAFVVINYDKSK